MNIFCLKMKIGFPKSTFLKDLKYSEYGEKSLWRCELPEILKDNNFISETFQELFFPELDLNKE